MVSKWASQDHPTVKLFRIFAFTLGLASSACSSSGTSSAANFTGNTATISASDLFDQLSNRLGRGPAAQPTFNKVAAMSFSDAYDYFAGRISNQRIQIGSLVLENSKIKLEDSRDAILEMGRTFSHFGDMWGNLGVNPTATTSVDFANEIQLLSGNSLSLTTYPEATKKCQADHEDLLKTTDLTAQMLAAAFTSFGDNQSRYVDALDSLGGDALSTMATFQKTHPGYLPNCFTTTDPNSMWGRISGAIAQ